MNLKLDNNKPIAVISLVSKQTIPNILFIKYLQNENIKINKYFFFDTEAYKTEKENIIKVLNIKENETENIFTNKYYTNFDIIYKFCKDKLEIFKDNYNFIFNFTGGTKIMSAVLFELAKNYNCLQNLFYVDGNKVYNLNENIAVIEDNLISIKEYFDAVGTNIQEEPEKLDEKTKTEIYDLAEKFLDKKKNYQQTAALLNRTSKILDGKNIRRIDLQKELELQNFEEIKEFLKNNSNIEIKSNEILSNILISRKHEKNSETDIKNVDITVTKRDYKKTLNLEEIKQFIKDINFTLKDKKYISKSEIKFLSGDWLEKFVYFKIKEKLKDNNIWINVKITNPNNEMDVCFLYQNQLYIVECKTVLTTDGSFNDTGNFNQICYTLNTIKERNGLFAKHFIVTLQTPLNRFSEEQQETMSERAKNVKIKLIGLRNINDDLFSQIINNKKEN